MPPKFDPNAITYVYIRATGGEVRLLPNATPLRFFPFQPSSILLPLSCFPFSKLQSRTGERKRERERKRVRAKEKPLKFMF